MRVPLKVLHLEDDPRDRELVREVLGTEGILCEIECVETRDGFIAALGREEVGSILPDYKLPRAYP